MSIATWKEEFYPVPASRIVKKDAAAHSLKKWRGLTKANLKKHGLEKDYALIIPYTGAAFFRVDASTCALCIRYYSKDVEVEDDYRDYAREYEYQACSKCPLFIALGNNPCTYAPKNRLNSPYGKWIDTGDATDMIKALEKTVKLVNKK